MRVLIAPDSFKGTIGSVECAQAIAEGWLSKRPDDQVILLPMADGGEGTLEAIQFRDASATRVPTRVSSASFWLLLQDGTAIVELANICGITLLDRLDPLHSSTFALGTVLNEVISHPGVKKISIAVGGSASTDGGVGALIALGARILDKNGESIALGGAGLRDIASIDLVQIPIAPTGGITCLTDVRNPLLGELGSARIFAPQKGADLEQVLILEAGLSHLQVISKRDDFPGAGAAGGTPFGLNLAWNIGIESGALVVASLIGLPAAIDECDLVITGEGKLDSQSYFGKVLGSVTELATQAKRRVIYCVGSSELPSSASTIALVDLAPSLETAMQNPRTWLAKAGAELAKAESI